MKTTKYIAIAAAILSLCACERKFEKVMIADASQFVAPVLQEMPDVTIDANNNKVEAINFVWSGADFGVSTQIDYSVYAQSTVGEENHTALLGSTSSTTLSLAKEDLNSLAVTDLALPRNESNPITVWVVASAGNGTAEIESSNRISFNVTTYDPPKTWVFFPGYYNSWGDNNDKEPWRVWEVEGGTGVYRTIVKLAEDATNTPGICPLKCTWTGPGWAELTVMKPPGTVGIMVTRTATGVFPLPSRSISLNSTKTRRPLPVPTFPASA